MAGGRKKGARKQGHRSNKRGTLRLDVRTAIGRIARASGTTHLPTLNKLKVKLAKDDHPAQFNRVRSSVQRFLRDTFGKRHAIYKAAADVTPLEETKLRKNNPQSVADIVALALKIEARHVGALWGMALTG